MDYQNIIKEFRRKLESRLYESSSIDTWLHSLKPFLNAYNTSDLGSIPDKEIEQFIIELRLAKQISKPHKRQMAIALKKFYLLLYERNIELNITNISKNTPNPPPLIYKIVKLNK